MNPASNIQHPVIQFLSKEDHNLLINGFCPCCHHIGFILGPRGGNARNALCPHCRREYCVSRIASQIVHHVCPIDRQRETYNLVPVPTDHETS